MRTGLARPWLAALLASAMHQALADDEITTLHPVVVTGTRVARDPADVAASVTVLDRSDIVDAQPRVDLTESLGSVPGIQGLNRHNYAQDLQISSRGFGARAPFGTRSIKLFTDGIPASMADGQGETSTFNLDQAQRIEILQGPLASIYGNQAGGIIQLFTREGQGPPTTEASLAVGSFGLWKRDMTALGASGGVSYLLDSSHFHTDGYRPDSQANRDQQMAKFSLSPTEGGKLTIVANANQQHDTQDPLGLTRTAYLQNPFGPLPARQGSTTYPDLAAAYGTRKSINHMQGGATYDQAFGDDHLQTTLYSGNRHVTQFQSAMASFSSNSGVVDYGRDFYGADMRWIRVRPLGDHETLTLTAGLDNDQFQDNRKGFTNFTTTETSGTLVCGSNATCGVFGNQKRQEMDTVRSVDPYFQAEWDLQSWVLSGGLRYSRVNFNVANSLSNGLTSSQATAAASGDVTFTHTTPVLSALYRLNNATHLYVSGSQGFETPTLNEMFYSRNGANVADVFNFGLKAATVHALEAGVKSMLNSDTQATFAVYHVRVDNEAVVDINVNGAAAYKNAQTQRDGAEWSLDSQLSPTVSGKLSLTLLHAFFTNPSATTTVVGPATSSLPVASGNILPGVAEKYAYAELAWDPLPGLSTAAEFSARGRMFVEDSNTQMPAPGYAIASWRLQLHQEVSGWKLKEFVRVDNLFDRTYVGSVIVGDVFGRYYEPAPGRNGLMGVNASYQF